MKKLLILSGKGGTGKTTVASAFIKYSSAKAFADCDVDAPNLHLIMKQPNDYKKTDYYGMGKAKIDTDKCISCGLCYENCRFDAIDKLNNYYKVDLFSCEGCRVCEAICPVSAIKLYPDVAGELMLYKNSYVFSTAKLKMGSGTSGKLVTEVKKQLDTKKSDAKLAIIDGSPGIGCPVIASLSGVDMVLIVAEPSLSGISDMTRIINTARIFDVLITVCVNKYDTNEENTKEIEKLCANENIAFVGKIPYDSNVIKTLNKGKSIIDIDCPASTAIKTIYNNVIKKVNFN